MDNEQPELFRWRLVRPHCRAPFLDYSREAGEVSKSCHHVLTAHTFGEPMYNDIVEEMDCIDSRMYIRIGLVLE